MVDQAPDKGSLGEGAEARPHEPELAPPCAVDEPAHLRSPLVFSSPHSGNVYPARFLAAARLDAMTLRRSEDAYVDDLFSGAAAIGAPLLKARFPRAFLDVNREPYELDPRMFEGKLPSFANTRSMRVAGGLGTIARIVGESREIYSRRLPVREALQRVDALYKPYHRTLRRLLQRATRQFGLAVLVDCHSMPSNGGAGVAKSDRIKADFVVGDRYGTSCDGSLVEVIETRLRRLGYLVQRNKPYAGGFITEHYGTPAGRSHAVQIEVNRSLYMNETTLAKAPAFATLTRDITEMIAALAEAAAALGSGSYREAAE
ncbi:MAG: N-formylglutamate amidohydrolase [Beijerinckiaceae bacterium]